jgi:hypothetical protein
MGVSLFNSNMSVGVGISNGSGVRVSLSIGNGFAGVAKVDIVLIMLFEEICGWQLIIPRDNTKQNM